MATKQDRNIKFTELGLARLKPESKRVFYSEAASSADRRGLLLAIEPKGRKRFIARVHRPGELVDGRRTFKAQDVTLGTFGKSESDIDIAEAHRRFAKVRDDVRQGKAPTPFVQRRAAPAARRKRRQRREHSPFFDRTPDGAIPAPPAGENSIELLAYEFYWEDLVKLRKRPEYAARILEADIIHEWRGRDARTITPREVVVFLRKVATRAPVMANRVASLTSQMFRFGVGEGLVDSSPYQMLRKPGGREKPRQRVLSSEELKTFWHVLSRPHERAAQRPDGSARQNPQALPAGTVWISESVRCALRILLLTGARRGEIASARWENISDTSWTIPATSSKSGHGHDFPITAPVRKELAALRKLANGSHFVLPSPVAGMPLDPHAITTALRRSVKAFDIGEFTVHDLRRTMRTGLSALGVTTEIAERTIGHLVGTDIQRTYDVHDFKAERRDALTKWAAHVMSLLAE